MYNLFNITDKKSDSVSTGTEPVNELQGQTSEKTSQFEEAHPEEIELSTKSTTSKEEVEEDLDDNEISKIKEFLEETVRKCFYTCVTFDHET